VSLAEHGYEGTAARGRRTAGLAPATVSAERIVLVKVQIDVGRCQGHGRCYDLAPGLFGDDEEGYGKVLGDGVVPPGKEDDARRAALNCPEHAIELIEGR
jgi:ferredoxin